MVVVVQVFPRFLRECYYPIGDTRVFNRMACGLQIPKSFKAVSYCCVFPVGQRHYQVVWGDTWTPWESIVANRDMITHYFDNLCMYHSAPVNQLKLVDVLCSMARLLHLLPPKILPRNTFEKANMYKVLTNTIRAVSLKIREMHHQWRQRRDSLQMRCHRLSDDEGVLPSTLSISIPNLLLF